MTASLACFLGKLLQEAKNNCGDSLSEFVIVDDNAQLSPENRIKNAVSFASNVSSAGSSSCHLNSRWSSQPSLVTSMMKQSFNLESPSRWNSSIEPCADDPTTQKINASWNAVHDIGMDKNASTTWSNNKLNDIIESAPKNHILPSNPLISMNCPKRRPSSDESSMDVPPLLQGSRSPRPFQSRFLEKRNHSDRLAQNSLRSALGGMAPKSSSFTERKRGVGKKDYAAPSTRMPTPTSSSKKKKKAAGSPPKGIRKLESCSEPRINQSL